MCRDGVDEEESPKQKPLSTKTAVKKNSPSGLTEDRVPTRQPLGCRAACRGQPSVRPVPDSRASAGSVG